MELVSGQILNQRFRIERLIGHGGMGAVYLAYDPVLDRVVAIKQLVLAYPLEQPPSEQLRHQFQREAQALANLQHPNLPRVTDFFEQAGFYYLVMDYIEGTTLLEEVQRQSGGLEADRVLAWADQLLSALEYIHARNFIHRDIKPANIRLTSDGRVFLVDFGLVKKHDGYDSKTLTLVHALGTLEYAPPEQYDPGGHTDQRSDLYALGATLYHLLSGQSPTAVSRRIAEPAAHQPLRHYAASVSPDIERVIERSMEMAREKRFASAADMRAALQLARHVQHDALGTVSLADQPMRPQPVAAANAALAQRPRGRRRAVVVGASMLGVVLIAVLGLTSRSAETSASNNRPTSTVDAAAATQTLTASPTPTLTPIAALSSTLTTQAATLTLTAPANGPADTAPSATKSAVGKPAVPTRKPTQSPPVKSDPPTPRSPNANDGNSGNDKPNKTK